MLDTITATRSLTTRAKILAARGAALRNIPLLERAEKATILAQDSTALAVELAQRMDELAARLDHITPYLDEV